MSACRPLAATAPALSLGEVLRVSLASYAQSHSLPPHHWRILRAIMACRTPALGGHLYRCSHCQREHFIPHSCRNRHCPTCQGASGYDWMEKQADVLLPIPYFHLVFTLPHTLNPLIRQNQSQVYDLLFASASATLLEFGRNNLDAQIGITAVLHTWSQTLLDHYHLHCIVTGGGLRAGGSTWAKVSRHWLFPVRALSVVFRAKFLTGLKRLYASGRLEFHGQTDSLAEPDTFNKLLREAGRPAWVVYAKRPFAGPRQVLAYLARYTHRVGITNRRLRSLDVHGQTVTFEYKDYAERARKKLLTLSLMEFTRRFRLHLLPERFVKIRHYGLLSNRNRHHRIAQARAVLESESGSRAKPERAAVEAKPKSPPLQICPYCQQPALVLVRVTHFQRPPTTYDSS